MAAHSYPMLAMPAATPKMLAVMAELGLRADPPGPSVRGWVAHRFVHVEGGECRPTRRVQTSTIGEALARSGVYQCWRCQNALGDRHRRWLTAGERLVELVIEARGISWNGKPLERTATQRAAADWALLRGTAERTPDSPLQILSESPDDDNLSQASFDAFKAAITPLRDAAERRLADQRHDVDLAAALDLAAGAQLLHMDDLTEDHLDLLAAGTWRRQLARGGERDKARTAAVNTFHARIVGGGFGAAAERLTDQLEESAEQIIASWAAFGPRAVLDPNGRALLDNDDAEDFSLNERIAFRAMVAVAPQVPVGGGVVYVLSALRMAAVVSHNEAFVDLGALRTSEMCELSEGAVPASVAIAASLGDTHLRGDDLLDVARTLLS